MSVEEVLKEHVQQMAQVYASQVLSGRTREVVLVGRRCEPAIQYTFLGYELKAGRKRITCPDLTTARYLAVFLEIGAATVRIPYDPSRTARLLPSLELVLENVKKVFAVEGLEPGHNRKVLWKTFRAMCRALKKAETAAGSAISTIP